MILLVSLYISYYWRYGVEGVFFACTLSTTAEVYNVMDDQKLPRQVIDVWFYIFVVKLAKKPTNRPIKCEFL